MGGTRPYSPTKLDAYRSCPNRYYLIHELKKTRVSDESFVHLAQMGLVVHQVIDRYIEWCRTDSCSQNLDQALRVADEVWDSRVSGVLTEDHYADFISLVMRWARRFMVPLDGTVRTELPIGLIDFEDGFELADDWLQDDVALREKPDYVYIKDNHGQVVDWKTGWAESKPQMQLEAYAFGVWCWQPHLDAVTVRFCYLRVLDADGNMVEEKETFDRHQLLELAQKCKREMRRIDRDEEFKPKPTLEHCLNCPVAYACEGRPSGLEKVTTKKEAEEAAADLALLEVRATRLKKALKGYTSDHGPVKSGGVEIETEVRSKICLDVDAQVNGQHVFDRALELVGLAARPYLTINMQRVKADGLLDHRLVGPLLREITTQKVERRFRKRKAKTDKNS